MGRRFAGPVEEVDFTISGVNPKRPLTFYAVHLERGLCGEFTVAGEERKRVDCRLQRSVTLTGKLVDGNGKPVVGHHVHANRLIGEPGKQRYAIFYVLPEQGLTDASGQFRICGLLPEFE